MTVESTSSTISYLYTGPGAYSYLFKAYLNSDIVVEHISTTGVFTTLSESTDYTLLRAVADEGGTVTTTYSPTTGILRISRVLPVTQTVALENQGPLDMETLEKALDRNIMITQQIQSDVEGLTTSSDWLGAWVTGTAYKIRNIVQATDGNWYTCLADHTAAALFATDLAAGRWLLVIDVSAVIALKTVEAEDATMVVTYGATTIALKTGVIQTANIANSAVTSDKIANGAAVPVGSVIAFTHATPPTGYLVCDGAAISRSTYSVLFAVIATSHGVGNGTTTFNVPDYRGRFLRGLASGQTTDPDSASRTNRGDGLTGDYVGTKQADGVKAHTHASAASATALASQTAAVATANQVYPAALGTVTGSTGGNETRPINIYVQYCIKY